MLAGYMFICFCYCVSLAMFACHVCLQLVYCLLCFIINVAVFCFMYFRFRLVIYNIPLLCFNWCASILRFGSCALRVCCLMWFLRFLFSCYRGVLFNELITFPFFQDFSVFWLMCVSECAPQAEERRGLRTTS